MTRRENSMSKRMKRLSRPLSMMLSRRDSGDLSVPVRFNAEELLPLDFGSSKTLDFFEHDPTGLSTSLATSPTESASSASSSRLSGSSWQVKRDNAIFIYQDDACMSVKEAYNPFAI